MNHLRTGNSFLGPSSFKNYKFLGKELQESGFYDLGARFYMPDIARFNAHDPLSEVTLDPYGYAYNNPLYYSDATGLRSDPINGGMEIGGPQGLDGPGEDPKPNELGGANRPYQIPTIDLKAPIRAMASNPASIMPSYCSVCYSGNGMSSGITLSAPQIRNVQPKPLYRGPENGQGGGLVMMDSMWEVLGIVAANMKPENQEAALGLAAIAIITTQGRAAPAIIKAEVSAEKNLASGLVEDLVTVRHHTSTSAVNAIKKSGYINVSSPKPFGVDVEVSPFISPSKVSLGQAAGGETWWWIYRIYSS
ncbi:RHS repeat-associated core domain-containing protein [Chryseobacterium indologenes]|uniref:RHS repeat-associated core domain-containing protein n=1 Tax=Chryseobacterium indologenes TaxID=253 RepID=UPI0030182E6A